MSGSEKPEFSVALAVGRALDLTLPDSRPVRDAYAQGTGRIVCRGFSIHVVRSWLYSAKLALKPQADSRCPNSSPLRCFCTIAAWPKAALPIVDSK